MSHRFKKIFLAAAFLAALWSNAPAARAEQISFSAELSANQVPLGQAVRLTLTLKGVTNIGDMKLPELKDFDVQYLGPSTHVSIVNGKYYSSKSFAYTLLPLKTGRFQIQPFNIVIDGTSFSTLPLELEVVDAAQQIDTDAAAQANLKDKINLVLRVPKNEVYLNEALPVKVMLLVSNLSLRDIRYPQLNSVGFMVGDFEQPKQYQQIINGVRYDIVEFDTVIYPTRTGELSLGPAQMESNLLVSADQSLSSLFEDEFFQKFFDRGEKRPLTLKSEPVTIKVNELPADGKPENFSSAVGNYDFDVSATPTEVRAGDPITLRMSIKGRGNLKAIEFPELADTDDFKIYKPNIKEDSNAKTLEQVIIPMTDQVTEVPAMGFSFFDPQIGKYQTITKGPFPLKVKPLEEGQTVNVVGLDQPVTAAPTEEKLGTDIVFIKDNLGKLGRADASPISPWYFVLVTLALAAWFSGVLYFQWTHRMATDQAFAKRLRAPQQARKDLNSAKVFLNQGKEKEFYDAIFKSFERYLAHKFQLPPGSVSAELIARELGANNSHGDVIRSIDRIFKECDSVRYASGKISREDMQESYHQIEKLIDYFERHVK